MEQPSTQDQSPHKLIRIDTVLVVDDDDNWCFLTQLILQKAAVFKEIIVAHNGLEAFRKIEAMVADGKRLPELILLDIKMPVMDGFEFLEEVQKVPELDLSQTRIYMSTSSFLTKDKERAKLYPVSGFITKPLTEETLRDILTGQA